MDKPWYRLGHGIVLTYIAIGWLSSLCFLLLLKAENRRRQLGYRNEIIDGIYDEQGREDNGRFESVEAARREKGDQWSGFQYTL